MYKIYIPEENKKNRTKKIQRFKIKDDYIYRKNYAEILMLNKPQGKRQTFYLKLLGQNDAHNPET